MDEVKSRLMTVEEMKHEYKFSHTGIWRAINAGHIEAVKRGRSTFIVRDSVERHLATLPRVGSKNTANEARQAA
jgi:hypothetical protein